ncbi:2Fe-2S iron-sulfur cluster-binding protein [Vibrio sp. PP-XX7]
MAAALLSAGVQSTRETPVSHSPSGTVLYDGSCFECRVEVNGEANVSGLHAAN